jgi:hypothetical protein
MGGQKRKTTVTNLLRGATTAEGTRALTELATIARNAAALGRQLQAKVAAIEDLIDRLAVCTGTTVEDVYAPLFCLKHARRPTVQRRIGTW